MSAQSAAAKQETNIENALITKTILLNKGDIETKRQEIRDYFHKSFSLYESIFECLNGDEAFYARANRLRHPHGRRTWAIRSGNRSGE